MIGAFYHLKMGSQERVRLSEVLAELSGAGPAPQPPERILRMVEVINASLGGEDLRGRKESPSGSG